MCVDNIWSLEHEGGLRGEREAGKMEFALLAK